MRVNKKRNIDNRRHPSLELYGQHTVQIAYWLKNEVEKSVLCEKEYGQFIYVK